MMSKTPLALTQFIITSKLGSYLLSMATSVVRPCLTLFLTSLMGRGEFDRHTPRGIPISLREVVKATQ